MLIDNNEHLYSTIHQYNENQQNYYLPQKREHPWSPMKQKPSFPDKITNPFWKQAYNSQQFNTQIPHIFNKENKYKTQYLRRKL